MKKTDIERTKKIVMRSAHQSNKVIDADGGSQATVLVQMMMDAEVFCTPDDEPYVTININQTRKTMRLKDKTFQHLLERRFYEEYGKTPYGAAVTAALGVLSGQALQNDKRQSVNIRIAENKGIIYLDLANEKWEVVEIDINGWSVITNPPVKFRRPRGMLALPNPTAGGSINELKPFINYESEKDFTLLAGWLVSAMNPNGPYAVLTLFGEQGSAKSTTERFIRALIDPNKAPLRSQPHKSHDLMIAANNGWCLAFDNLSYISTKTSDDLCRLATGGGFSVRELYSDKDETIFEACRPVMMNAITEVANRSDLLDRLLIIYLPRIDSNKRRSERELWSQFESARPRILGALCEAVSTALRRIESTTVESLPRMADFTKWVTAAEEGFGWESGTFQSAYESNGHNLNELAIEASLIAHPIRRLAENNSPWEGTATELLNKLNETQESEDLKKNRGWPKSGPALGGQLRRITPNLRRLGIDIDYFRSQDTARNRLIRISNIQQNTVQSVQSVQSDQIRTNLDTLDTENTGNVNVTSDASITGLGL